jgi:hypothetical protein
MRRTIEGLIIPALVAAAGALIGLAAAAAPAPGSAGSAVDLRGSSSLFVKGLGTQKDRSVSAELVFAAGEWLAHDDDGEVYSGSVQSGTRRRKNKLYFSYDAAGREAVARVVASWARQRLLEWKGIDTEVAIDLQGGSATGTLKQHGAFLTVKGSFPFIATAPELGRSRRGVYRFEVRGPVRSVIVDGEQRSSNVEIVVEGGGRVLGEGISCDAVCSFAAEPGSAVLLEAEAASGWAFDGWSGCDDAAAGCAFLVTGDRRITASFRPTLASTARITSLPATGLYGHRFRMTFECTGPVCTFAGGNAMFTIQWKAYRPGSYPTGPVDWSTPSGARECSPTIGCSANGRFGEILWPNPETAYWCFRVKNGSADSGAPYSTERCIDVRPQVTLL